MAPSARIDELKSKFDENPRRFFAPFANELRKQGDFTQAIAICRSHLTNQPGHVSGHIVLAQALLEASESDAARAEFETALGLDPENLIALRNMGDIARDRLDYDGARVWYSRVLDTDPRNIEIVQILRDLPSSPGERLPVPVRSGDEQLDQHEPAAGETPVEAAPVPATVASHATPVAPIDLIPAAPSEAVEAAQPSPAPYEFESHEEETAVGSMTGVMGNEPPAASESAATFRIGSPTPASTLSDYEAAPEDWFSPVTHAEEPHANQASEPPDLVADALDEIDALFAGDEPSAAQEELVSTAAQETIVGEVPQSVSEASGDLVLVVEPQHADDATDRPEAESDEQWSDAQASDAQASNELVSAELVSAELTSAEKVSDEEVRSAVESTEEPVEELELGDLDIQTAAPSRATPVPELNLELIDEATEVVWETASDEADDIDPVASTDLESLDLEFEPANPEMSAASPSSDITGSESEMSTAASSSDMTASDEVDTMSESWEQYEIEDESRSADHALDAVQSYEDMERTERETDQLAGSSAPHVDDADSVFASAANLESHEPPESVDSGAQHTPAYAESLPDAQMPFVTETLAELYLQQGFREEALSIYRQLLSHNPRNEQLRARVQLLESEPATTSSSDSQAEHVGADASLSAHSFFARLASRHPSRRSAPAELTQPNGAGAMDSGVHSADSEGALDSDSRSSALTHLFKVAQVSSADVSAAESLAAAFGGRVGPAQGVARSELSLDHLFHPSAGGSNAITLDGFYAVPRGASSGQDEVRDARATDIREFTSWLEGLKKK